MNSSRVIFALTVFVAALIAPLVTGQYWMSLITQVYIYGLLALSVDLLLGHAGLYSLCQASFFAVAAYTTPENAVKSSPIPLHRGTIKYL